MLHRCRRVIRPRRRFGRTIAYVSISRVLEDSLAINVAAATREGTDALQDIDRRMNTYAELFARRPDVVALVEQNDAGALEKFAVAEFNALHASDPSVASLEFTDAKGVVIMRGHHPSKKGDDKSERPQIREALAGRPSGGLTVSATSGEAAEDGVRPLTNQGSVVGTVKIGAYFRQDTAAELKRKTGLDVAFVAARKLTATTLGNDAGVQIPADVLAAAKTGVGAWPSVEVKGRHFMADVAIRPSDVGEGMAVVFLADRSVIAHARNEFLSWLGIAGALMLVVLLPLIVFAAYRATQRIHALASTTGRLLPGILRSRSRHRTIKTRSAIWPGPSVCFEAVQARRHVLREKPQNSRKRPLNIERAPRVSGFGTSKSGTRPSNASEGWSLTRSAPGWPSWPQWISPAA
jgi:Double sensory domain of two-component sensor kinase